MDDFPVDGSRPRSMYLGKLPVYPNDHCDGLTFRQWMIGMAIQGFCACDSVDANDRAVDLAFDIADKVIARMEDELRQHGK